MSVDSESFGMRVLQEMGASPSECGEGMSIEQG